MKSNVKLDSAARSNLPQYRRQVGKSRAHTLRDLFCLVFSIFHPLIETTIQIKCHCVVRSSYCAHNCTQEIYSLPEKKKSYYRSPSA